MAVLIYSGRSECSSIQLWQCYYIQQTHHVAEMGLPDRSQQAEYLSKFCKAMQIIVLLHLLNCLTEPSD